MRIACFLFGLIFASSPAFAGDPCVVNDRIFSCTPKTLRPGSSLQLSLAKVHGRELGVQRLADNTWFFLVVDSPPAGMRQLMPPQTFSATRTTSIPANYKAPAWDTQRVEAIFSKPGNYELYVSDNLESEDGGFKCKISVARQ